MGSWQPTYKKLGLSLAQYVSHLHDLYWVDLLSQQQIATKLQVHITTIENHFSKYNIPTRSLSEANVLHESKIANLEERQLEILDGIMLGDGHLDGSSVSARLTYGCKYLETLQDIELCFEQVHFSNPWRSKNGYWHFKSSFCLDLKKQKERWYVDSKGEKIIPNDVRITPLSAYWWFVGDGYQVDYGLQLCTESFKSQEVLVVKLRDLGFESRITPSNNRMRICGKSAPNFLNWISSNVKISSQYDYKWGDHCKQSEKVNDTST